MAYAFESRTTRALKRVFGNRNFNQRRAMFLLAGREHANVGGEQTDT